MLNRLAVFLIVAVSLVFGLLVARSMIQSRNLPREQFVEKKLRVLTYATFVGASGPANELFKAFEKETRSKIQVVSVPDAGLLLQRLKLQPANAPIDVVIGLDQALIADAKSQHTWKDVPQLEGEYANSLLAESRGPFAAIDWSPLTFISRTDDQAVPSRIDDLLKPEYRAQFALQDPRASTPGLQFVRWITALKGEGASAFFKELKPNVSSVAPNWAFSYGLFKEKKTRFVFSYLTSLAFHWGDEKDRSYRAVEFAEGHPLQIEFAAIPNACGECELASQLVAALRTPRGQSVLMRKNYMYPVLKDVTRGTIFAELPALKLTPTGEERDFSAWDHAFPH